MLTINWKIFLISTSSEDKAATITSPGPPGLDEGGSPPQATTIQQQNGGQQKEEEEQQKAEEREEKELHPLLNKEEARAWAGPCQFFKRHNTCKFGDGKSWILALFIGVLAVAAVSADSRQINVLKQIKEGARKCIEHHRTTTTTTTTLTPQAEAEPSWSTGESVALVLGLVVLAAIMAVLGRWAWRQCRTPQDPLLPIQAPAAVSVKK